MTNSHILTPTTYLNTEVFVFLAGVLRENTCQHSEAQEQQFLTAMAPMLPVCVGHNTSPLKVCFDKMFRLD